MAARTIKRRRKTPDIEPLAHNYLINRQARERMDAEEGRGKKELLEILATDGELVEGGHRIIRLKEPHLYTNNKGVEMRVIGFKRQRRVSQNLDEEATLDLLTKRNLLEKCTKTITVLDEDAILAANFDGSIEDKELQALYQESENFALLLEYDR